MTGARAVADLRRPPFAPINRNSSITKNLNNCYKMTFKILNTMLKWMQLMSEECKSDGR